MSGIVEWVGHATVRVELDGVRLLTDPVLRNRVAHLRRVVPVDRRALRGVDAVLVSHGHLDHLDLPSLERLGRDLPIVIPRGLGPLLRRRRFAAVTELEPGDELRIGALTVRATPAAHQGGRPPFPGDVRALGYAVEGSARAYFAGDTDLFDELEGLVAELDLALVPIWGWGPTLGRGQHLDPERAAEAVRRLRPRVAVPIHWGTYFPAQHGLRGAPAFTREPVEAFVRATAAVAPEVEVRVLRPGESTPLP
ncbi:MAG TPA: MBL fold metallo-hydrolase [Gaiellaceae bacterium]|nr:MBL fold metallo-hydrolase [Gaiellaceae bacterium]